MVKFATDITQSSLQNAERAGQIEAIGKSQAVIEFELDGTIIIANENFLSVLGYDLNEVQGKHHSMFVDPVMAAGAEYKAFWAALGRGEYQAAEYKRIGKGGKEVWIQASYNPILNPEGEPFKVVKFATDITEQVKSRAEAARLVAMIDNMPINVIMCDAETLEINYVNKASIATLTELQGLLPVKVADILGQTIDIFHKDPSHQRRLLADPKNLPHRAKIKLGDETLDLQVSAIMDVDGSYIGPMLAWQVVTAQVSIADDFERNVAAVVQGVSSAATEMESSARSMTETAGLASEKSTMVASASEQLQASISEISQQVVQSLKIAQQAVEEADRSSTMIGGLQEGAVKIGDIVSIIQDIASQTNLLALNATIDWRLTRP